MDEITYLKCSALGALGGVCPSIANMAGYFSAQPEAPMPAVGAYIGIALFGVIGAIVAIAFGERRVKAAIVAGIAAPGIISNVISGASSGGDAASEVVNVSLLMGAAYAQESDSVEEYDAASGAEGSTLEWQPISASVNLSVLGPHITDRQLQVYGSGEIVEGRMTQELLTTLSVTPSQQMLSIPGWVDMVSVGGTSISVSPNTRSIDITAATAPAPSGDFLWSLGGKRGYRLVNLSLHSIEAEQAPAPPTDTGLSALEAAVQEALSDAGLSIDANNLSADQLARVYLTHKIDNDDEKARMIRDILR